MNVNVNFTAMVRDEITQARSVHPQTQVSLHHGYAIILEELDEFWEQVKLKRSLRNPREMLKELVQIAAMAQRTAEDIVIPLVHEHVQLEEANRPPTPEEMRNAKVSSVITAEDIAKGAFIKVPPQLIPDIDKWCGNHPGDPDQELITVCSNCLQASCWQGVFLCDQHKTAGTVQKSRAFLRQLGREHFSYWKTDAQLA